MVFYFVFILAWCDLDVCVWSLLIHFYYFSFSRLF